MTESFDSIYKGLAPDPKLKEKLSFICRSFRLKGDLIIYRLIPSGHINTAYYVALYDGREVRQFLVQMVNWYVFKDPVSMMNNIDLITKHIMSKQRTIERRRRLHFHHTADGDNFLILTENPDGTFGHVSADDIRSGRVSENGAEFWRLYNFVEHSVSFETSEGNTEVLRMSGMAFGRFMHQLQDFNAESLVESIPHFHDTRHRLNTFFADVDADPIGRVCEVRSEIEDIREYREFAGTLCEMIERGELPIRVTHNDTKTNNILFDRDTLDPLVIIDLDTCMPGLACYDFGDTIRFAACTGAEDDPTLKLDMNLFRAYAEGYITEAAAFLTEKEIETMALGAPIITLELTSRFLDDYITGDKYFRIDYPTQNLDRARAQLSLFKDMMLHLDEMKETICQLAASRDTDSDVKIYST